MTIKDKKNEDFTGWFTVLIVTVIALLIGCGLGYLANILAIMTSAAPGIIQTILYGLGTLALGFASFVFLAGTLGMVGFALYSLVDPSEKKK